jgi:hypothetical protein
MSPNHRCQLSIYSPAAGWNSHTFEIAHWNPIWIFGEAAGNGSQPPEAMSLSLYSIAPGRGEYGAIGAVRSTRLNHAVLHQAPSRGPKHDRM